MADHIQPEPTRRPSYDPPAFEEANDPLVQELRRRVQDLEQEKRRWKLFGVTALICLFLMLIGGGVLLVGTASFSAYRIKQAQMQAEMDAQRAVIEEEKAQMLQAVREQQMLDEARREAARQAEKGAK
jgi:hypothetical protein